MSNIKHTTQNAISPLIAKFLHIPHKEQHAPTNGWLSLQNSIFMLETVHKIYVLVIWMYSYQWQVVHVRRWCTESEPKPLEGSNKLFIITIVIVITHKLQKF